MGPHHFFSGGNFLVILDLANLSWDNFIHYPCAWILSKLYYPIIHHNLTLATSQWEKLNFIQLSRPNLNYYTHWSQSKDLLIPSNTESLACIYLVVFSVLSVYSCPSSVLFVNLVWKRIFAWLLPRSATWDCSSFSFGSPVTITVTFIAP